jgi:hypothetical protein
MTTRKLIRHFPELRTKVTGEENCGARDLLSKDTHYPAAVIQTA